MTIPSPDAPGRAPPDFDDFCAREHPRLVGAIGLYCGDPALAEDLAQEALARACLRWQTVGSLALPSAWVHRVAINLAHSYFRRQAVRRRLEPLLHGREEHVDADAGDALAVREALAALKPRTRLAIVLRYYLDYSVADTADTMSVPPNTVKTLVRRGLAEMQQTLNVNDTEAAGHA